MLQNEARGKRQLEAPQTIEKLTERATKGGNRQQLPQEARQSKARKSFELRVSDDVWIVPHLHLPLFSTSLFTLHSSVSSSGSSSVLGG